MIKSIEELDRVRDECKSLVTNRSLLSAGAAAVPLPGVDVAVDVGLLATMLPEISKRFRLDPESMSGYSPETARKVVVIATSLGSQLIGKLITKELVISVLKRLGIRVATKSVAKYIPFVGSALAASVSFGAMKLVGNGHVDDCYNTVRRLIEEDVGAAPVAA